MRSQPQAQRGGDDYTNTLYLRWEVSAASCKVVTMNYRVGVLGFGTLLVPAPSSVAAVAETS